MNFDTYERQSRADFAALAEAVASVLAAAVRMQSGIRLQQVQHRAKDPASLKQKLEKAGALTSKNIEDFAKDLAGCRLVFYTNSDVTRFMSSRIISDNFDIDWERTKIHYPDPDSADSTDLFISNNYVVKFNDQRISLPEYARFQDMWCEVQVQTTLNHAWSEMAHDTIYKRPTLKGFGGSLMKSIEERMKTIMRDFLLPAGYEFQKVHNDFERLSSGKELFDRGALKELSDCRDNNTRYELLQSFETHVLPYYDDLQSVQAEVRIAVVAAVKQARETSTQPIATPFGSLSGHTVEQIVGIAADIIDRLRYLDVEAVEATFDAICDLFPGAKSDEERNRLLESAKSLAHHELEVWKEAGPLVQQTLVARILRLDAEALERFKPIVMTVLEEVLRPEVSGTTSTYDAFTIRTGAVSPSEALARTRANATEILMGYFRRVKNDVERLAVVQCLSTATTTPHIGNYPNTLLQIVLEDTERLVDFYIEVAGTQSYELLQRLEHDMLWLYRRNRKMPEDAIGDSQIAAVSQRLIQKIFAFRDLINKNRGFEIFKTLVGYESIFPPAWEDDEFDEKETFRNERIRELVNEVTEENADEWLEIVSRCAQVESNDLTMFPSFEHFLKELGRAKPRVVITYLDRLDDRLANFLPAMLIGLESGGSEGAVREKINQWIDRRQYLRQVIWYQRFATQLDVDLLARALGASLESGNDVAVLDAISVSTARHDDVSGGLVDKVVLPAIDYLTAKGNTRWVYAMWPLPRQSSIFRGLKSEDADFVLSCLVQHPEIDYRVEGVLNAIAESWPEKVVDFFGSRLRVQPSPETVKHYDAIPWKLHSLYSQLEKIPDYIVGTLRGWFDEDNRLFAYRGGRFLSLVFPNLSSDVEICLNNLLTGHNRKDFEFVVEVLQSYKGQPVTHNLYKSIVAGLPGDDPLLNKIEAGLESTGFVRGEFGFVAAYKRKKSELEPWLSDTRESVRLFARRHMRSLDQMIAAEQRRSEEDVELRKRDYES